MTECVTHVHLHTSIEKKSVFTIFFHIFLGVFFCHPVQNSQVTLHLDQHNIGRELKAKKIATGKNITNTEPVVFFLFKYFRYTYSLLSA